MGEVKVKIFDGFYSPDSLILEMQKEKNSNQLLYDTYRVKTFLSAVRKNKNQEEEGRKIKTTFQLEGKFISGQIVETTELQLSMDIQKRKAFKGTNKNAQLNMYVHGDYT